MEEERMTTTVQMRGRERLWYNHKQGEDNIQLIREGMEEEKGQYWLYSNDNGRPLSKYMEDE